MKFDLERAKKEGFLYKNRAEYVNATILGILNPGTSLEAIVFKFSYGITEYSTYIYVSNITDMHKNHPRELWVAICQQDNGPYCTPINCHSQAEITGYIHKQSIKNVISIKCIYREGEE